MNYPKNELSASVSVGQSIAIWLLAFRTLVQPSGITDDVTSSACPHLSHVTVAPVTTKPIVNPFAILHSP